MPLSEEPRTPEISHDSGDSKGTQGDEFSDLSGPEIDRDAERRSIFQQSEADTKSMKEASEKPNEDLLKEE
jgi:hypothetical protein